MFKIMKKNELNTVDHWLKCINFEQLQKYLELLLEKKQTLKNLEKKIFENFSNLSEYSLEVRKSQDYICLEIEIANAELYSRLKNSQ
jgi:hypothetical protein